MKTKIIGLAAITLALVMTMGTVSATTYEQGCTMQAGVDVTNGYAHQLILTENMWKISDVTIGNMIVDANCTTEAFTSMDALALISFDPDVKGTGTIDASIFSGFDPTHQLNGIGFGQEVKGTKVVIWQETEPGIDLPESEYYQDLVMASEGYTEFAEQMQFDINTCHDVITRATVLKEGFATTSEPAQCSMAFHFVGNEFMDPGVMLTDYAAASGIGSGVSLDFELSYLRPDC